MCACAYVCMRVCVHARICGVFVVYLWCICGVSVVYLWCICCTCTYVFICSALIVSCACVHPPTLLWQGGTERKPRPRRPKAREARSASQPRPHKAHKALRPATSRGRLQTHTEQPEVPDVVQKATKARKPPASETKAPTPRTPVLEAKAKSSAQKQARKATPKARGTPKKALKSPQKTPPSSLSKAGPRSASKEKQAVHTMPWQSSGEIGPADLRRLELQLSRQRQRHQDLELQLLRAKQAHMDRERIEMGTTTAPSPAEAPPRASLQNQLTPQTITTDTTQVLLNQHTTMGRDFNQLAAAPNQLVATAPLLEPASPLCAPAAAAPLDLAPAAPLIATLLAGHFRAGMAAEAEIPEEIETMPDEDSTTWTI